VPRGRQEAAFWNLGIAATVLRRWRTARDAWAGYGIDIPPGDDEIVDDFGVACVRIATRTGAEVVWGRRICPTRARVLSVPFDPSRRYGEIVVHDGAPNGERVSDGRTYPVFDEIELFAPSELGTLTVQIATTAADDVQALLADFDGHGFGAEPLASGNMLCSCCSERTQPAARGGMAGGSQRLLLAAPPGQAEEILERWRAASPTTRYWEGLHPAT
jgi:hypothetical protein